MITATTAPKRALIKGILEKYAQDNICKHFHISPETNLATRLEDFSKYSLLQFLVSTDDGEAEFRKIQRKYPLGRAPTLYLIYINHRPEFQILVDSTIRFAEGEREGGMEFGDTRAVRIVYFDQPGYFLPNKDDAIEIPLRYERRFEYNVGDPNSDHYGEHVAEYSLEQAYVWLFKNYSHGIICCSDFVAVRPIIQFVSTLDIECGLPYLTEDMLNQLAADALPRSATFSTPEVGQRRTLDVKTIVFSDPLLGERDGFREMQEDDSRHQTSGFYKNHPDLVFGGLGISRRYGRIWTPAHLSRGNLVALSAGLIDKTEQELGREYERNSSGYINYFQNFPLKIGDYDLRGKERDTFDSLLTAILEAHKGSGEIELTLSLLHNLVRHQKHLGLEVASGFDCPQCGEGVMGECFDCELPFAVKVEESNIVLDCPSCQRRLDIEEGYQCECGEEIPIPALENHIQIFPRMELLAGIQNFLDNLDDVEWHGTFFINGQTLSLYSLPQPPLQKRISLNDLRYWRTGARFHLLETPTGQNRKRLISILNCSREKCNIHGHPPRRENCNQCLERQITVQEIEDGAICLPRILGLAIARQFDGIHHRYEVADVKYNDIFDQDDRQIYIGIHLKSREKRKTVGRSRIKVKGLYTQTFYSAYLTLTGDVSFDVIGISIPNYFIEDVTNSIQELLNMLGLPLLVLDEEDWLKILHITLEQLEFPVN